MSIVREKPKRFPNANILIPPPSNKRHTSSPKKASQSMNKMPHIHMLPHLNRSLEGAKLFKPRLKLPSPRELGLGGPITGDSFQNSSTEIEVKSARSLHSSNNHGRLMASRIITEPVSRAQELVFERSVDSPNNVPQARKKLKLLTSKGLKPLATEVARPRNDTPVSVPSKTDLKQGPRRFSLLQKEKDKEKTKAKKLAKSSLAHASLLKINSPSSYASLSKEGELSARSHKEIVYKQHHDTLEDESELPNLGATKHSLKENGAVQAYAANTHKGLVRDYNEDRVAIILNISKPANSTYDGVWPKCSYFAIFDGHGGDSCADYLRDHLHHMIVKNSDFPEDPVRALRKGCQEAEEKFLERADGPNFDVDRSGSCAIIVLIVDDVCYVANVGDSRAIMSCNRGTKVIDLSKDHKPGEESEKERITKNGGRTYQVQIAQPVPKGNNSIFASSKMLYGPERVLPGRLSVSRTFGDIEAKYPKYGGLPNVVIAEPEIKTYKIHEHCDFIVLGCDGIFDKLSSHETAKCVWDSTLLNLPNCHQQSAAGVEYIMKQAMMRKTMDNVTVVLVALDGFRHALSPVNSTPSLDEVAFEGLKSVPDTIEEESPKSVGKKGKDGSFVKKAGSAYLKKAVHLDENKIRSQSPLKAGRIVQIKSKTKLQLSAVKKFEPIEDSGRSRPSPISRMPYLRNKKIGEN